MTKFSSGGNRSTNHLFYTSLGKETLKCCRAVQNKPAGVWSAWFGWVKVLITWTWTQTHMQKRTLRACIVNWFSFECTAAVRGDQEKRQKTCNGKPENQERFLCVDRWWGWVADKRQVKNKATQWVCRNWAVTSLRKELKEFLRIFNCCFGIGKILYVVWPKMLF